MSSLVQEYSQSEIQSISGKLKNIEIAALRTIGAYNKAYTEKGIVPTGKYEYPRSDVGYRAVQRLLRFDRIVKPEKGLRK